jgi:hypothetical protein
MPKTSLSERMDKVEAQIAAIQKAMGSQGGVAPVKKMLSSDEAATFLGIKMASLRQLCHRKLIPYYKPNGKLYFDIDELVAWQKRNHFESMEETLTGEN